MSNPPNSTPVGASAEAPPVLARSLTKVYGRRVGCLEASLSVPRGSIFALLGPNGAGKSTLVRLLLGLLRPTAGEALLFGQPPGPRGLRRVGYLPEQFRYQDWATAEEVLAYHAALLGLERDPVRVSRMLARTGLGEAARIRVGSFSKGMQQRLGLAVALLGEPDLLFLDEPTSALDPVGRKEVRELLLELRAEGKTVFLNSHLLTEVEAVADRVALMRDGRVVAQGSLSELLGFGHLEVGMRMDEGLRAALGERVHPLGWQLLALERVEGWESAFRARFRMADPPTPLPAAAARLVSWLVGEGAQVFEVLPRRRTLEDLFLEVVGDQRPRPEEGGPSFSSSPPPSPLFPSPSPSPSPSPPPSPSSSPSPSPGAREAHEPPRQSGDSLLRLALRGTRATAVFTFREMARKRIFLATLLLTLGFSSLFWLAARAASGLDPAFHALLTVQMLATGVYFAGFLTAFLAAFSTVGALSGEAESGLMLAVAARPVPRASIVAGKFLGYGLFASLYASLLYLALLLILRRELAAPLPLELRALALFCLQPLVVASLGLLASSLLPTTAAGVAVASIFALALIGGTVEQVGALVGNETMRRLGILSSLLLPTDSLYRMHTLWLLESLPPSSLTARAFLGPLGPISAPSPAMLVYAFVYCALCLALAARSFSRRDL